MSNRHLSGLIRDSSVACLVFYHSSFIICVLNYKQFEHSVARTINNSVFCETQFLWLQTGRNLPSGMYLGSVLFGLHRYSVEHKVGEKSEKFGTLPKNREKHRFSEIWYNDQVKTFITKKNTVEQHKLLVQLLCRVWRQS